MLVELAEKRSEPIPGLVYEGNDVKLGLGDFIFYSVSLQNVAISMSATRRAHVTSNFILSLLHPSLQALVGRASTNSVIACTACTLAVLAGLCATLALLPVLQVP